MTNDARKAAEPRLIDHVVPVARIPARGLEGRIQADNAERQKLADALNLVDLPVFEFRYQLRPLRKGRFRLTSHLTARATQQCVITLDHVDTSIDEDTTVEFWPAEDVISYEVLDDEGAATIDFEGPEPIENGIIDLGQFAYEILASSLDPYPRSPGAEFDAEGRYAPSPEDRESGAFSALRALKKDAD